MGIIGEVQNPHLRELLTALMSDAEISRKYKLAPAAKSIHHAYLGGLIEHVLSLCTLAKLTAAHYPHVDRDLLMTGVVLHDIGKIHELTYDRSFGYSTEGQLLGHIIIALRMVDEKIRQVPGFPPKLRTLVEHLIISHHGELEFGSPKLPLFPEALLLHHLDNLDSKMEAMRAFLHKDRHVDGCWTGYNAPLERSVLKKHKFLGEQPEPAAALAVAAPAPAEPELAKPAAFALQPTPQPPAQFKPQSLFGEKLKGALHKDS
jgi:3'-5' exoribonuclease